MKFSRPKSNQGFGEPDWLIFILLMSIVLGLALPFAAKHYKHSISPWMLLLAAPLICIALWAATKMISLMLWRPGKIELSLGTPVAADLPPQETNILDAAFKLVKQSTAATEAKDKLQQMFPTIPFAQITDSYLRACALGNACYDVGDQCRDRLLTDKQAVEWLRQQFPGFSPVTYDEALSWGYFLSR